MNKKFKKALTDAFYAPPPMDKAAFLKQHRRLELSRWGLVTLQIRYIRWWVWVLSLAVSVFILLSITWTAETASWYSAALTPFLALLAITENGRSQRYHMEELELACRVSRQSTVLARMVVLGLFHLTLLGLLTPVLAVWSAVGAVRAGVYLLTPYLLTAALGMELTRRICGWEGLLACGGAAALVSVLGLAASNVRPELYQPNNLSLWVLALAGTALAAGMEINLSLKERELQWN